MHPSQKKQSMLASFRFTQFLMHPRHGNRCFSSSTQSDIVLLFDFVCGLFLCNPIIFKYISSGKYNQKWIKQKTTDVIRVFLTWSWAQSTYLFFQLWARESDRAGISLLPQVQLGLYSELKAILWNRAKFCSKKPTIKIITKSTWDLWLIQ